MRKKLYNLNLLYVGDYFKGSISSHRVAFLKKIFKKVHLLNYDNFTKNITGIKRKIFFRYPYGNTLEKINFSILETVNKKNIHIVWFEKPIFITKKTIENLRNQKVFLIDFTVDNPFGERSHPVWHLYKKIINKFHINLVPRKSSVIDYRNQKCKNVLYYPLAYSRLIHFSPKRKIKQNIDISFTGSPYTNRASVIEELFLKYNIKVNINGNIKFWEKKISKKVFKKLKIQNELYDENYREKIWKSKINLSFTSVDNYDEYSERILQIIMSGGFCLHQVLESDKFNLLKKEHEIETFQNVQELANKIKFYLNNEKKRLVIIKNGQQKIKKMKLESDYLLSNFFKKKLKDILKISS